MTSVVVKGPAPTTPDWESVAIGDALEGPSVLLDATAVVLQVSGSQDWNRVHHDREFARDSGHRETFFNTGWTAAMLGGLLTDWGGPDGWLCHLDFRMTRMNIPGDTVHTGARITGKSWDEGGWPLVELDVWLGNDREGVTTTGRAVVRLGSRDGA